MVGLRPGPPLLTVLSSVADGPRCGTEIGGGIPLEIPKPDMSEFRRERPL